MTKSILFATFFSLLTAGAETLGATQPSPAPVLTVRFYNYAGVSATTLERAAEIAGRVYDKAGIRTVWMECRTRADQPVTNPACSEKPGASVIQVRLLSKSMAAGVDIDPTVFGYAAPSKTGGFGAVANIISHRVAQLARDVESSEELILGHVLAHEIGHLLLGYGGHSKRGLMRVHWDESELQKAAIGGLVFTKKQVKKVRAQAEAREDADEVALASSSARAGAATSSVGGQS